MTKLTIKAICGQYGLSVKELANKTGISYRHLRNCALPKGDPEKAKFLLKDAWLISEATGISLDLIDEEG